MKTRIFVSAIIILGILLGFPVIAVKAQTDNANYAVTFQRRNYEGPRLGLTYVFSGSELAETLKENEMGSTLSQFGWHFERQIIPEGGGPSFVVQLIPLIGGVEYGKIVPSGTFAMGIRFPSGVEFGLGPNIVIVGGSNPLKTSLVIGAGKSINYGGVTIPLNLVYATNPEGNRISFIFGYAIAKSR